MRDIARTAVILICAALTPATQAHDIPMLGCVDVPIAKHELPPPLPLPTGRLSEAESRLLAASADGEVGPPAPARPGEAGYEVGLKVLLLSATANAVTEVFLPLARQALLSYGIPFDHVVLSKGGARVDENPLSLEERPGVGKYYAIVLTSDQVAFKKPDGTWTSGLTPEQWKQLEEYERRYSARRVSLSGFPRFEIGAAPVGEPITVDNGIRMAPQARPFLSGLVKDAVVPVTVAWQNPGRIVDATRAEPFAYFTKPASDGTPDPLAAIVSRYPDGREQLTYFLSQSPYLYASYYLAPTWLNWMTRGVYLGKRRIYLNVQVDDLFLDNTIWNPDTLFANEPDRIYRVTTADYAELVEWQKRFRARLPAGSSFRIEMAYNGLGVYSRRSFQDYLVAVTRQHLGEFHWVSHTYSHPDLDRLSYARTLKDVRSNQRFGEDLVGTRLDVFSPHSLVLPLISGLFNGEALRALYEAGIRNVISDMSRRDHWPQNPYHGWYTTAWKNGFDGIFVIPRQPVVAPVSAGPARLMESFYNTLYRSVWGRDLNSHEIFDVEAQRVAKLLLAFRHDPYMFHQANLWGFDWQSKEGESTRRASLLTLWVEHVADEILKYVDLPILSAKMDDVAAMFQERMRFDACEFDGRLVVADGRIVALRGDARHACRVSVTGIDVEDRQGVAHEKYGPDRTTLIDMQAGGSISLPLKTAIPLATGGTPR